MYCLRISFIVSVHLAESQVKLLMHQRFVDISKSWFTYLDMVIIKHSFRSGVILSLSSGVVALQGFLFAWVGELFRVTFNLGLVVNLYRDRCLNIIVGALLFNLEFTISIGIRVEAYCLLATIILGSMSIGSILDSLGNYILNIDGL